MFSAPMFRREYNAATRRRRRLVFRMVFAIALGLVALLIVLAVYSWTTPVDPRTRQLYVGRALFVATIVIELLMLVFFVPAYAGGSIAEEREKDTLLMLLLSRLRPIEIVATKALARWLPSLDMILAGLPVLLGSAWAAGLEGRSCRRC